MSADFVPESPARWTPPDADGPSWRAAVACVRLLIGSGDPEAVRRAVRRTDPDRLARAALAHGVAGPVVDALTRTGLTAPSALVAERAAAAGRHLRALEDLATVQRVFDGAGLAWFTAKGPVLAEMWFDRPFLRSYDDLDVYVRPADLAAAIAALVVTGARVADDDRWLSYHVPGEVRIAMPSGGIVDLHWRPFFGAASTRRFGVGTAEIVARARRRTVDQDVPAWVPAPADGLVHLCTHAAIAGAHQLSWLLDVDRWIHATAVTPADLRLALRRWQAGAAVGLVLARSASTLGSRPCARLHDALPPATRLATGVLSGGRAGAARQTGRWRAAGHRAAGGGVRDSTRWAARAAARRMVPPDVPDYGAGRDFLTAMRVAAEEEAAGRPPR